VLVLLVDDHNAAIEHLGWQLKKQILKDSIHKKPSRQLRRYVARRGKLNVPPTLRGVIARFKILSDCIGDWRALVGGEHASFKETGRAYAKDAAEQSKLPR